MGLYNAFPKIDISKKMLIILVAVVIIVLAAIIIYQFSAEFFEPMPLEMKFDKQALDLGNDQAKSVVLSVFVSNTTGSTATNSKVLVMPVDSKTIIVYPAEREIQTLGAGEKRRLDFTVRTNPNEKIYAGQYTLNVVFNINEQVFGKSIVLEVKTAN